MKDSIKKLYLIYCYVMPGVKVYLVNYERKSCLYQDKVSKLFLPYRNIMFDEDIQLAAKFDCRDFALKLIESLSTFIQEDFKIEVL